MKCQFDVCHMLLYFACLSLMISHAGFCESKGGTLGVHDTGMVNITSSQAGNDTCNRASDITIVEALKDTKPLSIGTEVPVKTRRSLKNKRLFIISGAAVAAVAVIGVIVGLAGGDEKSDTESVADRPPGDPVIGVMSGL